MLFLKGHGWRKRDVCPDKPRHIWVNVQPVIIPDTPGANPTTEP